MAVAVGNPAEVGKVRPVVPDVLEAAVANGADHVVGLVVAVPAGMDVIARGAGLISQKRAALDVAGDADAGKGEHGGPEIYRAYQLIPYLARCQTRSPGDQRDVDARVVGPAFAAGQGAVVAPVEYPGVFREPVLFQLAQERCEFPVVVGDVRVHAGHGLPHCGRVGEIGRRSDVVGIEFR